MKKIVITGCNSLYFERVLSLVSSIHKESINTIDLIIIFNFGLTDDEVKKLNSLYKVDVIDFRDEVKLHYPVYSTFSTPKTLSHFLKMYSLIYSKRIAENILWIDAASTVLKELTLVFDIIENEHIFAVGDTHLNKSYTHNKCISIMNATNGELEGRQLSSGHFGYKSDGDYQQLIDDSWNYSQVEGCIDGFDENHRHDQSVLSILCSRYNVSLQDIDIYAYWTDTNRTHQKAIELGTIIFAGRGGINDQSSLIYK